jgi:hypothetical protein
MTSKDSSPSPASGVQACDLEVPAGLEEIGVLRRTIGGSIHRLSLQPGLLSEAAGWMDRKRACGGGCSTSSRST